MDVSANIDWISASYPFGYEHVTGKIAVLPSENQGLKTSGMYGYDKATRYNSGAIKLESSVSQKMGIHVVYTAKAIAKAHELYGYSQDYILNYLMGGARITRLDVCIDVKNSPVDIEQLYRDAKSGAIKTRAKQFGYVESATEKDEKAHTAATCYIGSMHKRKKLLRVYDKGAQLGLEFDLKRFELELHGALSNNAAHMIRGYGFDEMGETIKSMIAGYADFSGTHAGEIFTSVEPVKIAHPQYKKSDTAAWLTKTVAPVLAREVLEDPELFNHFFWAFNAEMEKLRNGAK